MTCISFCQPKSKTLLAYCFWNQDKQPARFIALSKSRTKNRKSSITFPKPPEQKNISWFYNISTAPETKQTITDTIRPRCIYDVVLDGGTWPGFSWWAGRSMQQQKERWLSRGQTQTNHVIALSEAGANKPWLAKRCLSPGQTKPSLI